MLITACGRSKSLSETIHETIEDGQPQQVNVTFQVNQWTGRTVRVELIDVDMGQNSRRRSEDSE